MRSTRPTSARLLAIIDALPRASVAVVGDAVLDEFEHGEIARVSREAPVLILDHRSTSLAPGGAGNTASNLAALDVETALIGRVGDDAHGRDLARLLSELGVDVSDLIAEPRYVTPTKTRILAGSAHTARQQIVRIDRGRRVHAASRPAADQLLLQHHSGRRAGTFSSAPARSPRPPRAADRKRPAAR